MQKSTIKRIWNGITTILVLLVVLLALLLWGFRLFGLDAFVVQSGSMEPACPVGAMVYVQEAEPEQLQVGDVITFNLGGGVRGTHRIVEITQVDGELAFVTKGDANEEPDNTPVTPENIVGRVCFTIPSLGFVINYIQQPSGRYAAISVVAVMLLLIVLPDLLFDDKKSKKQEEIK